MTILTLTFAIKKVLTGNHTTVIEAPEVQLMGDDLKEIECKVKPGTLVILRNDVALQSRPRGAGREGHDPS